MLGIKSSETFIFNPPPAGRPNPIFFYDGKTARERVVQEAKKGIECWHAVMCWLEPPVEVFHAKKFDQLHTRQALMKDRCDVLRNAEESLDSQHTLYLTLQKHYHFKKITKEEGEKLLKGGLLKLKGEERESAREVLQQFLHQNFTNDFNLFFLEEYQRKCNRCEELFLFDAFHPTKKFSEEILRDFIKETCEGLVKKYLNKEWKEISLFERTWALRVMSLTTCAVFSDFKDSTWNPLKKVTDLIEELKKGPLMVQGNFGRPVYKSDPIEIGKIAGRSIYGWLKGTEKLEVMLEHFHPILIVGADTKAGSVYFVDPLDRSDPSNPPPVYVMSYLKFQEGIATVEGIKIPRDAIKESSVNYAWSAKKFKGYI